MKYVTFNDFSAACRYCSVIPAELPTHEGLYRVPTEDKPRSKDGYIKVFSDGTALIGNWRLGDEGRALYSQRVNRKLTQAERDELRRLKKRAQQEERLKEKWTRLAQGRLRRRLVEFF